MNPLKKALEEGTPVYVDLPGTIIGLVDPSNPFWYQVKLFDGSIHQVEIRHINRQADEVHAVSGPDGSLTFRNTTISRAGVEELAEYLMIHRQTFPLPEQKGTRPMLFEEYRAILYQGQVSLVAINKEDPRRLHWGGGRAYFTGVEGEHYTLLKTYLVSDFGGDGDALEIAFRREYHPPVALEEITEPCGGWIAPDGQLYPCGSQEHDSLALDLSASFYGKMLGTGELLEKHWLHIYVNGSIRYLRGNEGKCTQAQLDTLQTLHTVVHREEFNSWGGIQEYRRSMNFETRHTEAVEW